MNEIKYFQGFCLGSVTILHEVAFCSLVFCLMICSGLPLMVGWFSLNLPAGLSLYYFSNTAFTSGQQIFLRKLGGAKLAEYDLGPIELGKARRTGETADSSMDTSSMSFDGSVDTSENQSFSVASQFSTENTEDVEQVVAAATALRPLNRRSKRKKLENLTAL